MGASDGGYAFPVNGLMGEVVQEGMSLHEYYVGQAIAGMCANPSIYDGSDYGPQMLTAMANQIADALIAARETK